MTRGLLGLALGVCVGLGSQPSRAQSCGRPDLLVAIPQDGSTIAPNALPIASYASTAEYLGEGITFEQGELQVEVEGQFEASEGLLRLTPPVPLEPGATIKIGWPELRGLGTASKGLGTQVELTVGNEPDTEKPEFEGVQGLEWDVEREEDECSDSQRERFVFDLELGAASDDGGSDNLSLLVFQTAGQGVSADEPLPIALTAFPKNGVVRVERTVTAGDGTLCFAAVARDLTGQVSASGAQEVCTEVASPPWFRGCSAAGTRPGSSPVGLLLVVLGGALWRRRKSV